MKRIVGLVFSVLLISYFSLSEVGAFNYEDTHLIVGFETHLSERDVHSQLSVYGLTVARKLSYSQKIYLVKTYNRSLSPEIINSLSSSSQVRYVQKDHLVTPRQVVPPNAEFDKQWGLFDSVNRFGIHAPEAWSIGVDGKTPLGDDIVVAVVDGGFDMSHPSLAGNIWVNSFEKPGNGIDDDGNGYIDDVNGWNSYSKNGTIPVSDHGTHVMGIVGAEAPLDYGTAGVNWDVDLMAVAGSSGRTSVIVESYSYVLESKKLWLKTGGQEGANVVATNSSFGIDFGDCLSGEYPVWNDLYNAMGELGILSAAATINSSVDVDKDGDVPTQCSSDFIVSVTNTTKQGEKFQAAGFGAKAIDLGAPGTDILSTIPGSKFGSMTGTSMATPHVAGAIGFLHGVASAEYNQYYREEPGLAALELKKVLLESVDSRVDLVGATVSGGQLNLYRAAERINRWPN